MVVREGCGLLGMIFVFLSVLGFEVGVSDVR